MKNILLIIIVALVAGCVNPAKPNDNSATQKKSNVKFQALGRLAASAVTCSALKETLQSDGRLEVRANVHNQLGKRIVVQVNCVRGVQCYNSNIFR